MQPMSSRFWKNLHPLIRRKRKPIYEDDTNFAILNAIDKELEDLEEETVRSKLQSSLKTATGSFLGEYGEFFGVFRRRKDEDDELYRERIIESVDIPRGTNDSIKRAVRRYLEKNTLGIEIYEPWKDIFYLNRNTSKLNGEHKLQGDYYHFAVIDVYIGSPFEKDIVKVIDEYKPAGVTLHTTYDPSLKPYDPESEGDQLAIPYVSLKMDYVEETLEFYDKLLQPLRGSIFMSDTKRLNKIFNLNLSKTSGVDVLSTGFGITGGGLHRVGTTSDLKLDQGTQMNEVVQKIDLLDSEFYINRDIIDDNTFEVRLRPTKQMYVILNVDELVQLRYPELNRFKGDYSHLLRDSNIQVTYQTETGETIELQAYNFKIKEWETLAKNVVKNGNNLLKTNLKDPGELLNENQLMVLRIKAFKDLKLNINSFKMDYESDVREVEVGNTIIPWKSHSIIVEDNLIKDSDKNPSFRIMLARGKQGQMWTPSFSEIPEDEPFPYV